jgi:protein TonB
MMGTLIESRAPFQRHNVGSVVSVIVHATLIASAVIATAAKSGIVAIRLPSPIVRIGVPAPPAREKPTSATPVQNTMAVPELPSIRAPMIIPTEIPAVDLTAIPTAADFTDQRSHSNRLCAFPCSGASAGGESVQPELAASQVIMQLREPPVPPRYPETLRRAGVDGTVVVKFVVDTLGRVDMTSIEVLSSSHDLFTTAVRETLGRMRFTPAKVGDRKVRATAMMPFHFTLK